MKHTLKTTVAVLVLVVGLMALSAREAYALWRLYTLTPQNLSQAADTFVIRAEDRETRKQFTVSITTKARKGSDATLPVPSARLTLSTKDDTIGSVAVAGERVGATTVYRFNVSPQALAHSHFDIQIPNFPHEPGKVYILGGGTHYTMTLKDFAEAAPANPAKRPGE